MAVDKAQRLIQYNRLTECEYSRPRHVFEFLNQLVAFDSIEAKAPTSTATTFYKYIMECSTLDPEHLRRFMLGYVFFTHFIHVECTISIATLVRAWNRGAAITCQSYNPRFDHIIPVMLDDANVDRFGPLYDRWNETQLVEARRSMSYILIDSKSYSNKTNWRTQFGGQPVENNVT
jgi:hypothetical protein